jgi:hypothetical protein
LYKRNKGRKNDNSEGKVGKTRQAVKDREAEEAGGNFLKADSKKCLKFTEEKRGDLGNV